VSSKREIFGDNEIETFNFHNKMASIICRDRENFRFSAERAAVPSGGGEGVASGRNKCY